MNENFKNLIFIFLNAWNNVRLFKFNSYFFIIERWINLDKSSRNVKMIENIYNFTRDINWLAQKYDK